MDSGDEIKRNQWRLINIDFCCNLKGENNIIYNYVWYNYIYIYIYIYEQLQDINSKANTGRAPLWRARELWAERHEWPWGSSAPGAVGTCIVRHNRTDSPADPKNDNYRKSVTVPLWLNAALSEGATVVIVLFLVQWILGLVSRFKWNAWKYFITRSPIRLIQFKLFCVSNYGSRITTAILPVS